MGGVEVKLHSFFTSAPDGGESSNIVTPPLYKISHYPLNKSWVASSAVLCGEKKNPLPLPGIEPRIVQPVEA
jgi:hypothetical protein